MGFTILVVFVILAVVVALGAIKIVPQGREFTVERFGRYTRTLKPGISFLTPFVETVSGWLVDAGHAPERIRTERYGGIGGAS